MGMVRLQAPSWQYIDSCVFSECFLDLQVTPMNPSKSTFQSKKIACAYTTPLWAGQLKYILKWVELVVI